jgi:hypothetical protein
MTKLYFTLYKITNLINGKYYIGTHRTYNLNDSYMGSGHIIKRAIKKHGVSNFKKEILFVFDTEEEMFYKEKEIVNEEFIKNDQTYNLHIGGKGGWNKNMVSTSCGKHVPIHEFKSGGYNGTCKYKVPVFNTLDGTHLHVDQNEYYKNPYLKPIMHKNGTVSVVDDDGNFKKITKAEYEASSKWKSITTNKVSAKTPSGEFIQVDRDEFLNTPELVGVTHGKSYKTKTYKIFDANGVQQYYVKDKNFREYLRMNNLPPAFIHSYRSNGTPIYLNLGPNKKRLKQRGWLKYSGWYAIMCE